MLPESSPGPDYTQMRPRSFCVAGKNYVASLCNDPLTIVMCRLHGVFNDGPGKLQSPPTCARVNPVRGPFYLTNRIARLVNLVRLAL